MSRTFENASVKLENLVFHENNAKEHTPEQIELLKKSIERHGLMEVPLVRQEDMRIIAGHGRVMAAIESGMEEIEVRYVTGVTDQELEEYNIKSNQLNHMTGYDDDALSRQLTILSESLDIDLKDIGFSTGELEKYVSIDDTELDSMLEDLDLDSLDEDIMGQPSGMPKSVKDGVGSLILVVVECDNESDQEKVYTQMTDQGYKCTCQEM